MGLHGVTGLDLAGRWGGIDSIFRRMDGSLGECRDVANVEFVRDKLKSSRRL